MAYVAAGNRLIATLPEESRERFQARCERVELRHKQVLVQADAPAEHVYYPEVGVCSVVVDPSDGAVVEVATIGREGFVGTSILLESDESPTTFCQVEGSALRLTTTDFRELAAADTAFRSPMLRYTQALMMQMAQSAACNRTHEIEERAARWLLMTRDRVDGDTFPLKQEFLAHMLGVRRQGVSVAAGILQKAGLITYTRGTITILDRAGLEEVSCECYAAIRERFDRLLR
ncbi:MAG TPA: Crp/Fnr family transcriptional regulator [Pirellulaceae bacterium]|jgi:CRP-like cAMP-binding protein|nr:Crp/Fnr family transcriptional regulator [Pirellulaceae bacterium]